MATFALELNETEIKTRELFNAALEGDKWTPLRAGIARVFVGEYYASLPVEGIKARLIAMNATGAGTPTMSIQDTLTALTREKALRSRMISGVRHYEVNY